MKLRFEKKENAQNGYKLKISEFGDESNKFVSLELSSWAKFLSVSKSGRVTQWSEAPELSDNGRHYTSPDMATRYKTIFNLDCECLPGIFSIEHSIDACEIDHGEGFKYKHGASDSFYSDFVRKHKEAIYGFSTCSFACEHPTPCKAKSDIESLTEKLDKSTSPYKDEARRILDGASSYYSVNANPTVLDCVKSALNEGMDVRDFRSMGALELIEQIIKQVKG